jgi:hypothetical protein
MARRGQVRKALPWALGIVAVLALIGTFFFTGRWNRQAAEAEETAGALIDQAATVAALPSATVDIAEVVDIEPTATYSWEESRNATATHARVNFYNTQTAIATYGTPTRIPTRTPAATDTPELNTLEGQAAALITEIIQSPPTYEEDFGNPETGWELQSNVQNADILGVGGYAEGIFFLQTTNDTCLHVQTDQMPSFSDFVLQVDAEFIQAVGGGATWHILFRDNFDLFLKWNGDMNVSRYNSSLKDYRIISYDLSLTFGNRPGSSNQITFIALGDHIIVFLNGNWDVLAFDDQPFTPGPIKFALCTNSFWNTRIEFDNLRIWDISDLDFEFTTP